MFEKKIYFNLWNGKAGEPSPIPSYCAIVRWGMVVEIRACFRKSFIEENGYEWFREELEEESSDWKNYKWLKKSLNRFVRQPKFWFKNSNFDESTLELFEYKTFYY